jgi:hypothetical protein
MCFRPLKARVNQPFQIGVAPRRVMMKESQLGRPCSYGEVHRGQPTGVTPTNPKRILVIRVLPVGDQQVRSAAEIYQFNAHLS